MKPSALNSVKLLNLTQLAAELGVSYSWIKDAHACGLPLMGGKTTVYDAMRWLRANPDFSPKKARELRKAVHADHQS